MARLFFCLLLILCLGCSSSDDGNNDIPEELNSMYFPPVNSSEWKTADMKALGWNTDAVAPLTQFLNDSGSKAFIILYNGRIAMEWYGNGADMNSNWQWNSAGKTLCAFTTGIAVQEGYLDIEKPSSTYLGNGWSSLSAEQENNITVRNHLTMTTGLDYNVANNNCTDPECLIFKNEPGSFWFYHNAPYTLIQSIVGNAVGDDFKNYFNNKLKNRIGMQGAWVPLGYFRIYYSNARSMARYGLLNLNMGTWDGDVILSDTQYFNEMTSTSQQLNKSYGYLWWLNGKDSFRLPGSEELYSGSLVPAAPADMFAGMGKDDQRVYVIPSKKMVVVRMGEDAGESAFGPSGFDNLLWEKISAIVK